MVSIKLENLSKNFIYHKKELGFINSIKNLIKREKVLKTVVKDVSFQIHEGEFVGLIGSNGAGKTTLLKMIAGIIYPSSGNITVLGYRPFDKKNNFKRQISIIMGNKSQLMWDLPVNESLYLNKCIYEVPDEEFYNIVNFLSENLNVKKLLNVQVRRLSFGERIKMEIIAGLIHNPKLILLDEPMIGLDSVSRRKIKEFLKYYNKKYNSTIILTSHYINDIESLCNKVLILNKGRLFFDGNFCDIEKKLKNKNKLIKLKFERFIKNEELKKYGELNFNDGYNAVIAVPYDKTSEIVKYMLFSLPIVDLNIAGVPLEEILLSLSEGNIKCC